MFKQLFQFYFYRLVPILGNLVSRYAEAYTYLPDSLSSFMDAAQLADVMRSAGWQQVRYRRLMLGTVAIHVGVKATRRP